MKNETVEVIAAEKKETKNRRISLKAKKIAIEEARDVCLSLANRKELRTVCTYLPKRQTHIQGGTNCV